MAAEQLQSILQEGVSKKSLSATAEFCNLRTEAIPGPSYWKHPATTSPFPGRERDSSVRILGTRVFQPLPRHL